MKITISKELTEKHLMDRTWKQAKEFEKLYNENELLRMFLGSIELDEVLLNRLWYSEILSCNLLAFSGGDNEPDETIYSVDILAEQPYEEMYRVHFYISQSAEIDTRYVWSPNESKDVHIYDIKRYDVTNEIR